MNPIIIIIIFMDNLATRDHNLLLHSSFKITYLVTCNKIAWINITTCWKSTNLKSDQGDRTTLASLSSLIHANGTHLRERRANKFCPRHVQSRTVFTNRKYVRFDMITRGKREKKQAREARTPVNCSQAVNPRWMIRGRHAGLLPRYGIQWRVNATM